jgi:thiamine kinase-like enzyme
MDASHTQPVEERLEDQPANGHPPTGDPIPNNEDHPQIEVDPPYSPATVSRESTSMYNDWLTCDQQSEDPQRPSLLDQPFEPAMEALARLEREDPKLAFQAARIVGLYRRLWESCTAKHIEGNKLAKANHGLRETHRKLTDEKNTMQSCHEDQIARLQFFDQALESSRLRLTDILKEWNRYSDGLDSNLSA